MLLARAMAIVALCVGRRRFANAIFRKTELQLFFIFVDIPNLPLPGTAPGVLGIDRERELKVFLGQRFLPSFFRTGFCSRRPPVALRTDLRTSFRLEMFSQSPFFFWFFDDQTSQARADVRTADGEVSGLAVTEFLTCEFSTDNWPWGFQCDVEVYSLLPKTRVPPVKGSQRPGRREFVIESEDRPLLSVVPNAVLLTFVPAP